MAGSSSNYNTEQQQLHEKVLDHLSELGFPEDQVTPLLTDIESTMSLAAAVEQCVNIILTGETSYSQSGGSSCARDNSSGSSGSAGKSISGGSSRSCGGGSSSSGGASGSGRCTSSAVNSERVVISPLHRDVEATLLDMGIQRAQIAAVLPAAITEIGHGITPSYEETVTRCLNLLENPDALEDVERSRQAAERQSEELARMLREQEDAEALAAQNAYDAAMARDAEVAQEIEQADTQSRCNYAERLEPREKPRASCVHTPCAAAVCML